ncbi:MAG: 2-dehydropantoate 2-reductase [Anaerolineae bacterium]
MRIAIIGAGGIGGYYGGRLVQAGEDVVFIARGANLAALQARGLRVTSIKGDFHLPHVTATDDPTSVGPVDLVIVAVKTYQTDGALHALPPLVGPSTVVLSLQNGVDAAERMAAAVGREPILGGLTYISAELVAPGEIRHVSQFTRVIVGEVGGAVTPRARKVVDMFARAGAEAELSDDIERDIWTKFMFIAVQGPMTGATRLTIGPIRDFPPAWAMYATALREIDTIARAKGIRLPATAVEDRLAFVANLPATMGSSMLVDVENGRRSEIGDFSGYIVRQGEALGIPTPTHRALYAIVGAVDHAAAQKA